VGTITDSEDSQESVNYQALLNLRRAISMSFRLWEAVPMWDLTEELG
jgi:hypothetical protein